MYKRKEKFWLRQPIELAWRHRKWSLPSRHTEAHCGRGGTPPTRVAWKDVWVLFGAIIYSFQDTIMTKIWLFFALMATPTTRDDDGKLGRIFMQADWLTWRTVLAQTHTPSLMLGLWGQNVIRRSSYWLFLHSIPKSYISTLWSGCGGGIREAAQKGEKKRRKGPHFRGAAVCRWRSAQG